MTKGVGKKSSRSRKVMAAVGGGASIFVLLLYLAELRECPHRRSARSAHERTGRINAEKKIRKEHQETVSSKGIRVESIGVIESPFPDRRQPIVDSDQIQ